MVTLRLSQSVMNIPILTESFLDKTKIESIELQYLISKFFQYESRGKLTELLKIAKFHMKANVNCIGLGRASQESMD